jgi:hypothetical protein
VHIQLHQRVFDAPEPVYLARLDDEDVTGAGLEFLTVHGPESPPLLDELDLVVRVIVWPGARARLSVKQERRHVDLTTVSTDEVMRAAAKREVVWSEP